MWHFLRSRSLRVLFLSFVATYTSFLFEPAVCNLEVEKLKKDGRMAAPDRYPFFLLREYREPASKRVCRDERSSILSDTVFVELEFTMRGVCTLWPNLLQCDTMRRYRLRGSLYKQMIDCYGNPLYTLLV